MGGGRLGWVGFWLRIPPPPSSIHGWVSGFPCMWLIQDEVKCSLVVVLPPLSHACRTSLLSDGCLWLWGYYFQCEQCKAGALEE